MGRSRGARRSPSLSPGRRSAKPQVSSPTPFAVTNNGQRVASLSGGARARQLPCPGRGLARSAEVLGRRPQARRSPSLLDLCGACAPVGLREEPAGGLHPGNLRRAWDPLSPRAPSRALSGSRVPSAELDLASQKLGRGHAQPGLQAALLCLTSAEPMRTNSCCPSSDELPV